MQGLYTAQIQPRRHVIDHADYTTPIRPHELGHTSVREREQIFPDWQIQIMNCSAVVRTDHTDHLSEVWTVFFKRTSDSELCAKEKMLGARTKGNIGGNVRSRSDTMSTT